MNSHELITEQSFRRIVRSIFHSRQPVPFSDLVRDDAEAQFVEEALRVLARENFVRLNTDTKREGAILTVEAEPAIQELAMEAKVIDETVTKKSNNEVLVVEDDPYQSELLLRAMRDSKNYRIVVTNNGVEALDYLFRRNQFATRPSGLPRLILLDIDLPGMSGHDVLNAIRESRETNHIPVVMFTSSEDDRNVVRAFSTGATSYIVKPVQFERFQETLKTVCDFWLKHKVGP